MGNGFYNLFINTGFGMKFEITMPYKLIACMIKIGIYFRVKCNKIGLFSFEE